MSQKILIDGSDDNQTQFALISNSGLEDFEFESNNKKNLKGNIYLGKVSRIEASLQAAFVEIGSDKNGFLAFGEIHPNYFQIPVADKEALIISEAERAESHNNDSDDDNNKNEETDDSVKEDEASKINISEENDQYTESMDLTKENGKEISHVNENQYSSIKNRTTNSNFRRKLYRSYKIQEVIKTGQLILVQVVKEERGNKGAALTSYISLAGKYSVLMPNSTKTKGISRKISLSDDRSKLKKIIDDLNLPTEMGLIIRTAGLNKTKNEIKKDYSTLNKLWIQIVNETKKAIAPALIHEEGNLLRRVVRDVYSKDIKEILVEGKKSYQETKKYMTQVLPSCSKYVKHYKSKQPLFAKHNVENEIIKMFEPEVKLKSGGYIVINPTEALVAIDVNSGGATKERNIEKTALKTNLEAVEEISKQIKIRDLSGLIVIDFIDMYEIRNNRQVERRMKESAKKDRARTQISRISQFGLLEMSRQRLRQSFIEWNTELSSVSIVHKLFYQIKESLNHQKTKNTVIEISPFISSLLKKNYQNEIKNIETSYGKKLKIQTNDHINNNEIIFLEENLRNEDKLTQSKSVKKKKKKIIKKKITKKKKVSESSKKTNTSKNENKPKTIKSTIKEIKNKKTGWWKK